MCETAGVFSKCVLVRLTENAEYQIGNMVQYYTKISQICMICEIQLKILKKQNFFVSITLYRH